MSAVARGVKNAFRSGIRASAVILILAISMGVALSMLLAHQAVKNRLEEVKASVGTTISVRPAGAMGMQGGGEPLQTADVEKLKSLAHVKETSAILSLILTTKGGPELPIKFEDGPKMGETNLESSVDPGTLGGRIQMRGGDGASATPPEDFKLPVRLIGLMGTRDEEGQTINLVEGRLLEGTDANHAVVGKGLAAKNNLTLGSTFTAYDQTFTVVGIFDAGTTFGNDALYIPLAKVQSLSESGSEITQAVVVADSVDHVESVVTAITATLGSNRADVIANEENALTAVESLRSVEKVSIIGFVIALGAAGVIIFLAMLMIVRERRREIGVLKAIGANNRTIVTQFVVEAVVLVILGATLGFGGAAISSNSIAGALMNSNAVESTNQDAGGPKAVSGDGFRAVKLQPGAEVNSAKELIGNITTNISVLSLLYGFLAALGIAILGSAIPAWLVTKVRPAEVLRGE